MNPVHLLRLTAGRTQLDLATLAGTSQSAIAAYEGDRKSPTWRTVERLAQAAGFEVEVRFVPPLTREERQARLQNAIDKLLIEAIGLGCDSDEVLGLIDSRIKQFQWHPAPTTS